MMCFRLGLLPDGGGQVYAYLSPTQVSRCRVTSCLRSLSEPCDVRWVGWAWWPPAMLGKHPKSGAFDAGAAMPGSCSSLCTRQEDR